MTPLITGAALPPWSVPILEDLLMRSNNWSARVTSVARSAAQQAQAMYNNAIRTGAAEQHDIYKEAGDRVIDVYEANKDKPEAEVVKLMAAKIREVGESNVSHHCLPADAPLSVMDIAQNSIVNGEEFRRVCEADRVSPTPRVAKLLKENGVWHLELFKPLEVHITT